jgi:hypothetical protein
MKHLIFFVFVLYGIGTIFAQNSELGYNYDNGNGTVLLNEYSENGNRIVIRKHEQRFSIEPSSMPPYGVNEIIVYENTDKTSKQLFKLKDGDYVNTLQVANIKNISGNISNWIKIIDDNNRTGWLDMDDKWDRYSDGIWSIVERIIINGKKWTVRKLEGRVSVYETLNVRNKPGTVETMVLFQLIPIQKNHSPVNVTILAITEETDLIDGKTDHWVYIKDDQNRTGWVFGGYTDVDRGGPKFRTPNNQIRFNFNLP